MRGPAGRRFRSAERAVGRLLTSRLGAREHSRWIFPGLLEFLAATLVARGLAHEHLVVAWVRDAPPAERERIVSEVAALGPF